MIPILYEDNHCLALDKPAGLLSQGDATGEPSLLDLARDDLKRRYAKPGNVFVGLVHRLDRPVSGVILLAKTSKGASRLSEQFRTRSTGKTYLAVVEGSPADMEGEWIDRLVKDPQTNTVRVVAGNSDGNLASLHYRLIETCGNVSLIELKPMTGRGHQLRVQLASRGLPIVGDRKYGAKGVLKAVDGGNRIALHASELSFNPPTRSERVLVHSELPADWPRFGRPG